MKFTLHISTDSKRMNIKKKCYEVLAEYLKKMVFSVECNSNEIDIDRLVKRKVKLKIEKI